MALGRAPCFKTVEQLDQLLPCELPLERAWPLVTQVLIEPQPLFHFHQTGKVIGRQDFSLHQRKVDFHLVEPAGMHRGMHQNGVRLRRHQALDGRLTTMRRSVLDDPKHSVGGPVRLLFHHLSHQSAKRFNARAGLAAPHDVPSRPTSQAARYCRAPPRSDSNSTRWCRPGAGLKVG